MQAAREKRAALQSEHNKMSAGRNIRVPPRLTTTSTEGQPKRYAAAAPGDISSSPSAAAAVATHSPSLLGGARRSREGVRTRGDWTVSRLHHNSANADRDDNYVQYHGPISPQPTDDTPKRAVSEIYGAPSPEGAANEVRRRPTNEPSALVGLGLVGTTQAGEARANERSSYLSRPSQTSNTQQLTQDTSAPVSDRSQRPMMHTGLPSAYTHGGSAPSDWIYAPRSGAITDGLPASMRFDNDWHRGSSAAHQVGAFRREPFYGSPTFAQQQQQQQQQQQPQQHQHRHGVGQNTRAPPPPTSLNYTYGNSWGRRPGSTGSSPTTAVTSLANRPSTSDSTNNSNNNNSKHLHRKDSSLTSSEGHASSIMFAHVGAQNSAATSLSSLRDASTHKASHTSFDLRTSSNGSSAPASRLAASAAAAALPALPSSGSSVQGAPEHSHQMVSRSFSSDRAKGKAPAHLVTYEISSSSGHSAGSTSAHSPSSSFKRVQLPAVRHDKINDNRRGPGSSLSPIVGSTPDTSVRGSREPYEVISIEQSYQETEPSDAAARPTVAAPHAASSAAPGALPSQRQNATNDAADAHRRFVLLQQLHLDELSAHAVENSGWLEPKNGCERVLMPRPTLHDGSDLERLSHSRQRTSSSVAFERHRAAPGTRSIDIDSSEARRRAQSLLSRTGDSRISYTGDGERRLFHHRMPPATPIANTRALLGERPPVPQRTSSRQGRHRSRTRSTHHGGSNATADVRTPALTPHALSSDDDDELGVMTPDLSTVLAQGRALDEERAQWRAEHKRSFGASRPSTHRRGPSDRDGPDATRRRSLRNVHSSPNLRRAKDRDSAVPPMPASGSPVTRSCFPSLFAHEQDNHNVDDDTRHRRSLRMRSKSLEGLSRLCASAKFAASHAMPCIATHGEHKEFDEKHQSHRAGSSEWKQRRRATTLSKYESGSGARGARYKSEPTSHTDHRDELPQPFVIGRLMFDEGTSPGLNDGPYEVRAPSWTRESVAPYAAYSPVSHYGAAISSPRPDIGRVGVEPDRYGVIAGRHVTQRGYHRPKSSDELAAILRSSQQAQARHDVEAPVHSTPPSSDAVETHINTEQAAKDRTSLPVPPRRRRSSHGNTGAALGAAQPSSGRSPTNVDEEREHLAEVVERAPNTSLPGLPLHFFESYAHPGAFQTPPLTQPTREGGGWFDGSAANQAVAALSSKRHAKPPNLAVRPAQQQSGSLAVPDVDGRAPAVRSPVSTTGQRTSEDSTSQHSRELWNTDDHGDESFNSLFFRRPKPMATNMSRSTLSDMARGSLTGGKASTAGSVTPSRRTDGSDDGRHEQPAAQQLLTASFNRAALDESPNENDSQSDEWITNVQDEELEQLMGSLFAISRLNQDYDNENPTVSDSGRGAGHTDYKGRDTVDDDGDLRDFDGDASYSRPSFQGSNEAAWIESSLGGEHQTPRAPPVSSMPMLSKQMRSGSGQSSGNSRLEQTPNMRIGRVDERQPRIEAAQGRGDNSDVRRTTRRDLPRSDNDEEEVRQTSSSELSHEIMPKAERFSRARLSSLTASVLLDRNSVAVTEDDDHLNRRRNSNEVADSTEDFIDFASPAATASLALPSSDEPQARTADPATSGGGGAFLELPSAQTRAGGRSMPRDSIVSQDDSVSSGGRSGTDSRRGSEGLLNMMRSRVWPTPPASPGPNNLGRGA